MISKPLFISVALSTVIFGPILHVGWASAVSGVTEASSLFVFAKKAEPPGKERFDRDLVRADERARRTPAHIEGGASGV